MRSIPEAADGLEIEFFGVLTPDISRVDRDELYVAWIAHSPDRHAALDFMDRRSKEFLQLELDGIIEQHGCAQNQSGDELYGVWFTYTAVGNMLLHMMRYL